MKLYKNTILSGTLTLLASASAFSQVPVKPLEKTAVVSPPSVAASVPIVPAVKAPVAQLPVVASVPTVPAVKAPSPYGPNYKGETFDKIKASGKVIIGYRSSSVPISYLDSNKKPIGYGVDVCLSVVEKIKEKLAMPNLAVEYVEVTSENRIPILVAGKVDLECGSTSNFAARRKEVDFTVPYYISSVRILTKNNSGIQTLGDLKNKRVAVSANTTSIPLLKKFNTERDMKITIVEEKSFPDAFKALESGKADAFVLLDLLLLSERLKSPNAKDYSIVGDLLSVEPLGVMIRKDDPKFKSFMDKEMIQLISSGKMSSYYKKWFESPISPDNKNLNIPQSSLLKDLFRMPTSITGN